MQRTVEAIEAEMAEAKASGAHSMSAKMRALRDELKAAKTPVPKDAPAVESVETDCVSRPPTLIPATSNPYDNDEARFIEKCLAAMQFEFGKGTTTGVVKHVYNEMWARVTVWRLLREIQAQVGVGGEWPQFAALNRNSATGKREDPRAVVEPIPQAVVQAAPAPGAMPTIRRPGREAILAAIGGVPMPFGGPPRPSSADDGSLGDVVAVPSAGAAPEPVSV